MLFTIESTLSKIRDAESHKINVQNAIVMGKAFKEIKGATFLADIMPVPVLACLDPMHLVYLGITKTLFAYLLKKKISEKDISNILLSILVLLHFKRKPRSLMDIAYWKANEWKLFLLYYCVICHAPPEITTLIAVLSTAIYLLSSNHVTQEDIRNSEKLLLTFQRGVHELCGDSAMTYSLYAISHLPMQVNWFGPL